MAPGPELEGRVAIVTGASRGLGRAMALALASAGADVAVAARSAVDLDETAHQIEKIGRRPIVVPTDVSVYAQVESLVKRTIAKLGGLHIVVNNSGIARVSPLAEMPPESSSGHCRSTSSVSSTDAGRGGTPDRRGGKVVNIGSVLGRSVPGLRRMHLQRRRHRVRERSPQMGALQLQVNALAPGWFVTDMNAEAFADPKIRERLLRDVPARRTGRPEEVGPLLVYLASSASDFMTGQTVFLDGGHSAA
jgi:2-deoxy-D-gluconate 3-dehydrogenase